MNYRLRLREGSDLTMYLEDFEAEIALLRAEGEPTGQEPMRTHARTD